MESINESRIFLNPPIWMHLSQQSWLPFSIFAKTSSSRTMISSKAVTTHTAAVSIHTHTHMHTQFFQPGPRMGNRVWACPLVASLWQALPVVGRDPGLSGGPLTVLVPMNGSGTRYIPGGDTQVAATNAQLCLPLGDSAQATRSAPRVVLAMTSPLSTRQATRREDKALRAESGPWLQARRT